jgi:hypothetical protein
MIEGCDMLAHGCETLDKIVANTHPTKASMSTSRPMKLLHMDLFRPTTYVSVVGNLYCLVVVDDYLRFTWMFYVQSCIHMQEVCKEVSKWIWYLEVIIGKSFITPTLKAIVMKVGIMHEVYSTYTTKQKWCCWELGIDHPCKNNVRWVWYTREVLGRSYLHYLQCIQLPIPSLIIEEDPYEFLNGRGHIYHLLDWKKPHIYHSSRCLVANATSTRIDNI